MDKGRDLDLLWRWMNQPHVVPQWKMAKPKEHIAAYIDANLADPHQDPYIGFIDGAPMSYWEAYWAKDDILGRHYPAADKDRGWHMLVGEPSFFGRGIAPAVIRAFTRFLFLDDPATEKWWVNRVSRRAVCCVMRRSAPLRSRGKSTCRTNARN